MKEPINLNSIPVLQEIKVLDCVILRPLQSSDAPGLLEILSRDKSIRDRVAAASRFHSKEDIDQEIETYKNETGLIRYTLLKYNEPIGMVSLWRDEGYFGTPPQLDDYGFGFFLDPNERGKGFVTKAVQTLMFILTKNLKVNQFVANCEDNNYESISVLKKLGFNPTDEARPEPVHGWIERKYIKQV